MTNELQLQSKLWEWAWNNLPNNRKQFWAVPNGLKLNPVQAAWGKASGLLSGVWDLHAFHLGQFHIIEAKTEYGELTRDRIVKGRPIFGQFEWGELMASHGAHRHLFRTLEEGQAIMKKIFLI